jgi:D-proline reductase (dithiol) PrdB
LEFYWDFVKPIPEPSESNKTHSLKGGTTLGDLSEFPLKYRILLKAYRWRRINPVPWAPLKKSVAQSRLVLVSSAGIVTSEQKPFDNSIRGGDPSIREIPSDVDVTTLIETHRSDAFDHTGIRQDPNLAFPADRLRELSAAGIIGSLNHRYLSIMGSVTAPGRLIKRTIPQVVPKLVEDRVDIALLIPV